MGNGVAYTSTPRSPKQPHLKNKTIANTRKALIQRRNRRNERNISRKDKADTSMNGSQSSEERCTAEASDMDILVNNNPAEVKEETTKTKAAADTESLIEELEVMKQTAAELNQYILSNTEEGKAVASSSRRQSIVSVGLNPPSAAGSRRQSSVGLETKVEQQSVAGSRRQSSVGVETKVEQQQQQQSPTSASRRQSSVGLETKPDQQSVAGSRRQSSVGVVEATPQQQGSRKNSMAVVGGVVDTQEVTSGGAAESRRNSVVVQPAGVSAAPSRRGSIQPGSIQPGSMTRRGSAQAPQDLDQMKDLVTELEKKNLQLMEQKEALTEELFVIRQVACQMNQLILDNNRQKAGPTRADPCNRDPGQEEAVKSSISGKFQEVRESLRQFMEEQYVRPEAWESLERLNLHIDQLETAFGSLTALH